MQFSFEIVVYLLGLAVTAGAILARISALERKVERHNSVVERTYRLEEWRKNVTERIDHIERSIENERHP